MPHSVPPQRAPRRGRGWWSDGRSARSRWVRWRALQRGCCCAPAAPARRLARPGRRRRRCRATASLAAASTMSWLPIPFLRFTAAAVIGDGRCCRQRRYRATTRAP
eukprot:6219382-Prymnesium_polylepis.1